MKSQEPTRSELYKFWAPQAAKKLRDADALAGVVRNDRLGRVGVLWQALQADAAELAELTQQYKAAR